MAVANDMGLEIMLETKKEEEVFSAPNFPMNNRLAGHQRNETMDNAAQKTKIKKPKINVNYDRLVQPSQTEVRKSEVSSIASLARTVDEEADKHDGTEKFKKPNDPGCEVFYLKTEQHHYDQEKTTTLEN